MLSEPRILPFALYMLFVGIEEGLRLLTAKGFVLLDSKEILFIYPVKAFSVGILLLIFSSKYSELRVKDSFKLPNTLVSIITGIVVFVLWINMDWPFASFESVTGYNPKIIENAVVGNILITTRMAGAVLVVPVMEEIFWRSFLIRYITSAHFTKIPVGQFTWGSFLLTSILFGLEHNLYIAGITAGIAYNLLLYHTKSIWQCIIAHAITNLALSIYVLHTGHNQFW